MAIDLVTIQKMTPEARSQLWMNAQNRLEAGGAEVIELIKNSGLPLRSGGMTLSDPVYLGMEEIIWSAEARLLLIEATERGLPALAGVEPLIVACRRSRNSAIRRMIKAQSALDHWWPK